MVKQKIKKLLRKLLEKLLAKSPILRKLYHLADFTIWENSGRIIDKTTGVPYILKQKVIKEYQTIYHSNILVETGTSFGDTIEDQRKNFKVLYSIELINDLYKKAIKRFRKYPHITIIQGDSGKVLKNVVPKLKEKSIFWLDGHTSEDCPIFAELEAIFASKINHILLIDDARCFTGEKGFPTLKSLLNFILGKKPNSRIEIKEDIIRVILG